jgi:hypothetical protein
VLTSRPADEQRESEWRTSVVAPLLRHILFRQHRTKRRKDAAREGHTRTLACPGWLGASPALDQLALVMRFQFGAGHAAGVDRLGWWLHDQGQDPALDLAQGDLTRLDG